MKRLHLFEFEDLDWVPRAVRDGGTDLLDLAFDRLRFYDAVAPEFVRVVRKTGIERILDLCSGGGGGTLQMRDALRRAGVDPQFLLTDLHPNRAGIARIEAMADPKVRYAAHAVDALLGGDEGPGLRTMSGALHHFPPDAVHDLVAGIVARRQPFAFFDVAASDAIRKLPVAFAPV